ncbi:MAG: AI-2E family transporter [Enterocloster clostridioformis]
MLLQIFLHVRDVACRLLRAYALLLLLTFTELYIGFLVLGIPAGFTLACITSLVDILPVLGTGTVLLPWAFIAWMTGSKSLALGLVCLYLLIAVVRQTLEPKIIGLQMGLSRSHPAVHVCRRQTSGPDRYLPVSHSRRHSGRTAQRHYYPSQEQA